MINRISAKFVEPIRWVIVAAIAYTLATTVLYFISGPELDPITPQPTRAGSVQTASNYDLNSLISKNIFGKLDKNPAPEKDNSPIVETRLPLELQGVFVAEIPEESVAIVAQKNRAGLGYHIGDKVPGNAELIEIHSQYIVLFRAGVRETLRFPYAQNAQKNNRFIADEPEPPPDEFPEPDQSADDASLNPEQIVDKYRQLIEDDPDAALRNLGVEPVSAGTASGYRLGSLAQAPYLSQTGLQPGDVILSVNGRPVGDVHQDQDQFEDLLAEGVARIEVQRGGRRFFVTASLK